MSLSRVTAPPPNAMHVVGTWYSYTRKGSEIGGIIHPRFTNEETKFQRGHVTCVKSASLLAAAVVDVRASDTFSVN